MSTGADKNQDESDYGRCVRVLYVRVNSNYSEKNNHARPGTS